jgi:hypothetical protein
MRTSKDTAFDRVASAVLNRDKRNNGNDSSHNANRSTNGLAFGETNAPRTRWLI